MIKESVMKYFLHFLQRKTDFVIAMMWKVCLKQSEFLAFLLSGVFSETKNLKQSTKSLKAVLLHNGNKFSSLPVAHSVMLKENCESFQMLLQTLKYEEYAWPVIGDFKMVGFLLGMQGGYTKYPCYLCLWDSRADALHYNQQSWPKRVAFPLGKHKVKNEHIDITSPLHIKLDLMKQSSRLSSFWAFSLNCQRLKLKLVFLSVHKLRN